MNILNIVLNCTLKTSWAGRFCVIHILQHWKKSKEWHQIFKFFSELSDFYSMSNSSSFASIKCFVILYKTILKHCMLYITNASDFLSLHMQIGFFLWTNNSLSYGKANFETIANSFQYSWSTRMYIILAHILFFTTIWSNIYKT
jgi:preprotein translocase subunit SecY